MITLNSFERSPRLSEFKISYRRRRPPKGMDGASPRPINSPLTAAEYVRAIWNKDTLELVEEFVVVCLTTHLEPVGWVKAFTGGFDAAIVDPRVVFAVALQAASAAILVAHNHPSGEAKPSPDDIKMTERLKAGCKILNIRFLDHIILTRDSAYSFTEEKLLKEEHGQ